MANSLKNIFTTSYIFILIGVLCLIVTNFSSTYIVTNYNLTYREQIIPKKELFAEFEFTIKELELLWGQRLANNSDLTKANRLKGIIEVELPQLNQKAYLFNENLPETSDFYKNGKSAIYLGEILILLGKKFFNSKQISPSRNLEFNETLFQLKTVIFNQNTLVEQEEKTLKKELDKSISLLLIIAGIISLGSILLIIRSIYNQQKYILKPINSLTKAVSKYDKKNYGAQIHFDQVQEFKKLSSAFNKMSASLKNNFTTIEERNTSLTKLSKKLKYSNEQLEEFAYIASHDLKTPIRGMNNLALYLKEDYADKLDEEGKKMLTSIQGNSKKMHQLIDDLLQYSRISKTELAKEVFGLKDLVNEVIEFLEYDQNPDIQIDLQDLINVKADKSKIRSVINNLFTNAVKYNDSEIKKISIWTKGGLFFFRDNGIGIDEKDYDKIFAFFRRGHVEKYEGTGAGMAIVKKILDRHDITIQVSSEVGAGTVFILDMNKVIQPQ